MSNSDTLLVKSNKDDIHNNNDGQMEKKNDFKVVCLFLFLTIPVCILFHRFSLPVPAYLFRKKIATPGNNRLCTIETASIFHEPIDSLIFQDPFPNTFFTTNPPSLTFMHKLLERKKTKLLVCTGMRMVLWLRWFARDSKQKDSKIWLLYMFVLIVYLTFCLHCHYPKECIMITVLPKLPKIMHVFS